jgi:hypothetical protein
MLPVAALSPLNTRESKKSFDITQMAKVGDTEVRFK